MKKIVAALAAFCVSSAFATCKDDWQFRPDKQKHFGGSVAMAGLGNLVTDNPWIAFAGSATIGGLYEIADSKRDKCGSWQDFGYDVAGSAIGAYLGYKIKGLIITPRKGGVFVAYHTDL